MRKYNVLLLTFFLLTLMSPHKAAASIVLSEDIIHARKAASSVNLFAFDMYRELVKKESDNIFFSPQNISSTVAMVYAGAGGDTLDEIRDVFHFNENTLYEVKALQDILNDTSKDVAIVSTANAIWPSKRLKLEKTYVDSMLTYFDAEITALDYQKKLSNAMTVINDWVLSKTEGKIEKLIEELSHDTSLVLTGTIYFNSEWHRKFPKERTKKENFYRPGQNPEKIDLMSRVDMINYFENDKLQAVELFYKKYAYSMLVVLPKEKNGIHDLESSLNFELLEEIIKTTRHTRQRIHVYIPKFRVETKYELKDHLTDMGLEKAFSHNADFSKLSKSPVLIDEVIHKTMIAVDEDKSEAAAATAIVLRDIAAPPARNPIIFRADHPYVYFILEKKTDTILFMGRYMGP